MNDDKFVAAVLQFDEETVNEDVLPTGTSYARAKKSF